MVAKLIKHELYALFRILIFFAVAVVVLAVAGRILVYFAFSAGNESDSLSALTIFVIIFYILAISAFALAAYILGINRFYRTLFTGEGYMTFSLPATASQLIWAKLISALVGTFFASIVSVLSLTVFLIGWNSQTMAEITSVFGFVAEAIGYIAKGEPLLFFEGILLYLVMMPLGLLVVFAVISIGQLFTSHRKFAVFAIIVGGYFVLNSVGSMLIGPLILFFMTVSIHLVMWIYIAACIAIDIGSFFLIRYILKNKVNLIT